MLLTATALSAAPFAFAVLVVGSPTSHPLWKIPAYSSTNQFDYFDDEQTGIPEADLVGSPTHPAFYTAFEDPNNTPSLLDGTLFYRIRVGADRPPTTGAWDHVMVVGMDLDLDFDLDIFLTASGNSDANGIWDAGNGLNISPNTTTIANTAYQTFAWTTNNFNFNIVNTTIDPSVGADTDLDADTRTDWFVTFSIPLTNVVLAAQALAGVSIDEKSKVTYVVATSTQDNAFNQDLNGVPAGQLNSTNTWQNLGAMTDPIQLPEPDSSMLTALGILAFACRRLNPRRPRTLL